MLGGSRARWAVVVGVAGLLVAACGHDEADDGNGAGISGEVIVFAAASLTEAFNDVAEAFEARYPGVDVRFNFGGTPTLRTQIEEGARADVLASANPAQMDLAIGAGVVEAPARVFARNVLTIITPVDNQAGIKEASDLAVNGLKLVVANEDVPAGAYTRQMLDAMETSGDFPAGFAEAVAGNFVSLESNVKQVVAKVELGEADAGIVYGTDVTPAVADRLHRIEVPEAYNVVAEYPVALVDESRNPVAGQAFIVFLLSEAGQGILMSYGFLGGGSE